MTSFTSRLLLPKGTSVRPLVTRSCVVRGKRVHVFCGEPGEIVQAARDIYGRLTVRFERSEGAEISYLPHEVVPVDPQSQPCPFDLRANIVMKVRIGSHAHGIARDDSDDDFRGVFISPADLHWSMHETPRRIEYLQEGVDEIYYEIGGFVRRLLTGDPMVLETLFSELVEEADDLGHYIRSQRQRFLTRPALMGFPYFLREQMRDLNRRQRRGKAVKPKALMHSVRLALSGLRALQTGEMTLEAREHADELIAIREGQWHFERVNQRVYELLREFENSLDESSLPEEPAIDAADHLLVVARAAFAKRWLEANPLPFGSRPKQPKVETRATGQLF